uniref:Uncharacterized protein n=1 Tax=Monodelphis domestica TaxID=13616 RepID=A0A5F8HCT6_MONDO
PLSAPPLLSAPPSPAETAARAPPDPGAAGRGVREPGPRAHRLPDSPRVQPGPGRLSGSRGRAAGLPGHGDLRVRLGPQTGRWGGGGGGGGAFLGLHGAAGGRPRPQRVSLFPWEPQAGSPRHWANIGGCWRSSPRSGGLSGPWASHVASSAIRKGSLAEEGASLSSRGALGHCLAGQPSRGLPGPPPPSLCRETLALLSPIDRKEQSLGGLSAGLGGGEGEQHDSHPHPSRQQEVRALWVRLHREHPDLLSTFEDVLVHASSCLGEAARERETVEQALWRRESDHEKEIRCLYEELEQQIHAERQRLQSQDSSQQDRLSHLAQELQSRDQELERAGRRHREVRARGAGAGA